MLDVLHAAEKELPYLLASRDGWRSYKLDHHPPFIDRMLRTHGGGKLYLHRIHPCAVGTAPYHQHPWPSAIRILEGTYELALGHGSSERAPPIAARLIACAPFEYEMTDPDAWHSVRPIGSAVMTVMLTGPRWTRPSRGDAAPLASLNDKPLSPLPDAEVEAMLSYFRRHYPPPAPRAGVSVTSR
jgi:hypothetical protein